MDHNQCGLLEDNKVKAFKELVELIGKKPWIIFVVFTLVFGYGIYLQYQENQEQNDTLLALTGEVSGLRVEVGYMNDIIKQCNAIE